MSQSLILIRAGPSYTVFQFDNIWLGKPGMSEIKTEQWSEEKFKKWYQERQVTPSRDYVKTLVPRIKALGERAGFKLEKYGEASYSTASTAATNNARNGSSVEKTSRVTHDLYRLLIGDFSLESPTTNGEGP